MEGLLQQAAPRVSATREALASSSHARQGTLAALEGITAHCRLTKLEFAADVGAQPEQDVEILLLCLVQELEHVLQVPARLLQLS